MARPGKGAGTFGGFAPNAANFMGNLVYHPCSVPFTLYVETFVPVFLNMLLFIALPEFNDVVRAAGDAHTDTPGRSKTRRQKHTLAYLLPDAEQKDGKPVRQALKTVMTVTQPLERIGYAFLLYTATERFFYNWSTLLHNFEHCGQPASVGPIRRSTKLADGTSTGTPQPLILPTLDQNRANWPTSNTTVTVPFGHYSITMEATFKSRAINDMNAQVGFIMPGISGFNTRWSDETLLKPGGEGSAILQQDVFCGNIAGCTCSFLRRSDPIPVGIEIQSASFSMYNFLPGANFGS